MSTFVQGQNARARRATTSHEGVEVVAGAEVTVEGREIIPGLFKARLQGQEGLTFRQMDFEPVAPPEPFTTPAPLDPTQVKAGDTVTAVGYTTAHLTYEIRGVVWEPSHSPGSLWVGPVALDATSLTITDHQPAPKPEWKPGTTGTATVRGVEGIQVFRLDPAPYEPGEHFAWATPDCRMGLPNNEASWLLFEDDVTDFVPDEPRPLPTLQQVEVATYRASFDGVLDDGSSWKVDAAAIHRHLTAVVEADATLAEMRGESR